MEIYLSYSKGKFCALTKILHGYEFLLTTVMCADNFYLICPDRKSNTFSTQ